jgi:hypothetical protein
MSKKVPRKIMQVDFAEMETRFLAHYLELCGCKDLAQLEKKIKKGQKEDLCQNEIV